MIEYYEKPTLYILLTALFAWIIYPAQSHAQVIEDFKPSAKS
jgi:hypothetical protein